MLDFLNDYIKILLENTKIPKKFKNSVFPPKKYKYAPKNFKITTQKQKFMFEGYLCIL